MIRRGGNGRLLLKKKRGRKSKGGRDGKKGWEDRMGGVAPALKKGKVGNGKGME